MPDGLLYTFSSNIAVTYFELYYRAYSIQKRDLIKQKLEIAASHHPWERNSKLFLKILSLQKTFGNTPSWVMPGTYIQPREIPKNGLNKKLKIYQLIYFCALDPYWPSMG